MRKNNEYNDKLKKGLFSRYEVVGLNQSVLLNSLAKNGIKIERIKKVDSSKMTLDINCSQNKKFFAITKELCYNIKKVKDGGFFYPLVCLSRRLGVLFGTIAFLTIVLLSNDVIFGLEFSGSGAVFERRAREVLRTYGVCEFSRFSAVDFNQAAKGLLKSDDKFSFVSVKRKGSRIAIELVASTQPIKTVEENSDGLTADVDGVVKEVKVYRGTAIVKEGDSIKKGDLLVGGFVVVKDVVTPIGAIARVVVEYEREIKVILYCDDGEEIAETFARAEFEENSVSAAQVKKEKNGEQYIYTVTLNLRKVFGE